MLISTRGSSVISPSNGPSTKLNSNETGKNANQIADLGRELYARLSVMGDHVAGMGGALGRAVDKYNAFVGSLETKVLTQARRFEDLQVEHQGKSIPELPAIESQPRAAAKLQALAPVDE